MKTLSSQYAQFTSKERIRLVLAANEREDLPELDRLFRTCPEVTRVLPDPKFMGPLMAMQATVSRLLILWLEVSILVMSQISDEPPAEDSVDAGTGNAGWEDMCAVWRGIEAGIFAFCAEAGITSDQLFALVGWRPTLVEGIGKALRGNGRINDQTKETIQQRLWQAWNGEPVLSQEFQNNLLPDGVGSNDAR